MLLVLSHYVCASSWKISTASCRGIYPRRWRGGGLVARWDFGGFVVDYYSHFRRCVSFSFIYHCHCYYCRLAAKTKANIKPWPKGREEWLKANAVLTELSDGLRESIGCMFGDKLMTFGFPPAVASGVQAFMDYCWCLGRDMGAWTYLLELCLRTFGLMYCIHLWLKDKYNPLITDFMNSSKS